MPSTVLLGYLLQNGRGASWTGTDKLIQVETLAQFGVAFYYLP